MTLMDTIPQTWQDSKKGSWLLGLTIPAQPFVAWGLVEATGRGLFWWWGAFFAFGLLPLLDLLVGTDTSNPPESAVSLLETDRYYRWCTYLFLPLQYVALTWGAWTWAQMPRSHVRHPCLRWTCTGH